MIAGRGDKENNDKKEKTEISNHINNEKIYKNKFKSNLKMTDNISQEKTKRKIREFEFNNINKDVVNQRNNYVQNLNEKKLTTICTMNDKISHVNKESLLKDLKSNNFMEFNLQSFNRNEEIRGMINYDFQKGKIFNMSNLDCQIKQITLDSEEKRKFRVDNLKILEKEIGEQKKLKQIYHSLENGNNKNKKLLKSKINVINNTVKSENNSNSKSSENKPNKNDSENKLYQKKMEKIEYEEILKKFLKSEELKCLLKSENVLNLHKDCSNEITKKNKSNEQIERLDSNYKNFFVEKLSKIKNDDFNETINFTHLNKFIKKDKKIENDMGEIIYKTPNSNFSQKTKSLNLMNTIDNIFNSKNSTLHHQKNNEFQTSTLQNINLENDIKINFVYDKIYGNEDKKCELSICNDLERKFPSLEDDNLLNTNYCYISNSLLDKLMNLQDPDIFIKIIEKIVVNNIVYNTFNKEKCTVCSNITNKNNNISLICAKEKENNIFTSNNISFSRYLNENIMRFNKIKIYKYLFLNRHLGVNSEDETYFSTYNKIKDQHNINKKRFRQLNDINDCIEDLDLDERGSFLAKMNDKHFGDENEKVGIPNGLNDYPNKSSNKNSGTLDLDQGYKDIFQKDISKKLVNQEKVKNFIKINDNSFNKLANKNFCVKSSYIDNINSINDETNSERFPNRIFNNLKVNNFNFNYEPM